MAENPGPQVHINVHGTLAQMQQVLTALAGLGVAVTAPAVATPAAEEEPEQPPAKPKARRKAKPKDETPAPEPEAKAEGEPVPVPSKDECREAIEAYADKHGTGEAHKLLAEFGGKLSLIPDDRKAEFVGRCRG